MKDFLAAHGDYVIGITIVLICAAILGYRRRGKKR
jgi:hypothetical protein